VYAVAVCELAADLEAEAVAMGALAGLTAYDVKMRLSGVLPRVLVQTPSGEEASRVVGRLQARGHGAVACDTRDVVASGDMIHVRRFTFESPDVLANARPGVTDRLRLEELEVVIVVATRSDVIRSTREKDVPATYGRHTNAATVVQDVTRNEHVVDRAAYWFPRTGRPWLLREREAQYAGLGTEMRPTRRENFEAMLALLRARARGAVFDDRFAAQPLNGRHIVHVRGHDAAAPALNAANDLIVHVLAVWLARPNAGPYR
jgi:hypothetical protein